MKIRTCHYCGLLASETDLFNYAAQNYIHPRCALLKWDSDVVDRLTTDQLEHFPVSLVEVLESIREYRRSERLRPSITPADLHAS
jgi:hypothetical protein